MEISPAKLNKFAFFDVKSKHLLDSTSYLYTSLPFRELLNFC